MINLFYKNYLDKLTATFTLVNPVSLIDKSTVKSIKLIKLTTKQKLDRLAKIKANKYIKNS